MNNAHWCQSDLIPFIVYVEVQGNKGSGETSEDDLQFPAQES